MKKIDAFGAFGLFMTVFVLAFAQCSRPKKVTTIPASHENWGGFYSDLNNAGRLCDSMEKQVKQKLKQQPKPHLVIDQEAIRIFDY